jgi:hypothetical protein
MTGLEYGVVFLKFIIFICPEVKTDHQYFIEITFAARTILF